MAAPDPASAPTAPPSPAPALSPSPSGGIAAIERPVVGAITCRVACAGLDRGAAGSAVRVVGEALQDATSVVFLGRKGPADDVSTPVTAAAPTTADVVVPAGARTGRLRVVTADGRRSKQSTRVLRLGTVTAADGPLVEARVDTKRVFLDGRRKPSVSYFVGGDAPAQVQVELVRDGQPAPVASWAPAAAAPGTVQTVEWDGATGGIAAPEGRYEFRVSTAGGAQAAQVTAEPARSGFLLLGHAFPVPGPHRVGLDAIQRFGAGRAGHSHQGHDVFAACGAPLVAARAGTVKMRATQSAAGNYVVIATDEGIDHAYMHLAQPSPLKKGDMVATGQPIGAVGDTGDANGCHLHFEMWSAPGWYTGGKPYDPLGALQAWDALS
jgi:murein DD-endopeptidase MepM/ murein hydrolase activator NlpD